MHSSLIASSNLGGHKIEGFEQSLAGFSRDPPPVTPGMMYHIAMAFRSDLETLILASLKAGSAHGYEICQRLNALDPDLLSVGEGRLYPALRKLETDGCIAGEWVWTDPGRPAKRIYTLTAEGSTRLENRRREWTSFVTLMGRLLNAAEEAAG